MPRSAATAPSRRHASMSAGGPREAQVGRPARDRLDEDVDLLVDRARQARGPAPRRAARRGRRTARPRLLGACAGGRRARRTPRARAAARGPRGGRSPASATTSACRRAGRSPGARREALGPARSRAFRRRRLLHDAAVETKGFVLETLSAEQDMASPLLAAPMTCSPSSGNTPLVAIARATAASARAPRSGRRWSRRTRAARSRTASASR